MKRRFPLIALTVWAVAAAGCGVQQKAPGEGKAVARDLSQYGSGKPPRLMRVLFIHHSCGGQWLADQGGAKEIFPDSCIFESHPNGGGLRRELRQNNYEVHEAAYRSRVGAKTDVCDWRGKFRDQMDEILRSDQQDRRYRDPSARNDIVVFKSCFPTSWIDAEGTEPGDPDAKLKSLANYKAAYRSLVGYFASHPDTLFVCVTAPPLARTDGGIVDRLKNMVGSKSSWDVVGKRARRFNNWLKDGNSGWLAGYPLKNVVVFDYYDVLTGHGQSDYSRYPTREGRDSHPSAAGNLIATREFIPLLNRAVSRLRSLP